MIFMSNLEQNTGDSPEVVTVNKSLHFFVDSDKKTKYAVYSSPGKKIKWIGNIQVYRNGRWKCLLSVDFRANKNPLEIFEKLKEIKTKINEGNSFLVHACVQEIKAKIKLLDKTNF